MRQLQLVWQCIEVFQVLAMETVPSAGLSPVKKKVLAIDSTRLRLINQSIKLLEAVAFANSRTPT
jgi:hypothetical protein